MKRREFIATLAAAAAAGATAMGAEAFRFRWLIASCLYGTGSVAEILGQLPGLDTDALDVWPQKHGNQREQIDEMGVDEFAALLRKHSARLACLTRYDLGPFRLAEEMRLAKRLGCGTIVSGSLATKDLKGHELKHAISKFCERLKPHLEVAAECNVTLAIENHGAALICTPDSIRWLVDAAPPHLALALAPYHLPQEPELIASLVRHAGRKLAVFYAWQKGKGSSQRQPKEQELLQMPGRGPLDFAPIVAALKSIRFTGWTSVFMHPFPRGIPIVDGGAAAVTAEVRRGQEHLQRLV